MKKKRKVELPCALYRAEQVRELDRCAIEDHAIAGYELMQRAGKAAFEVLNGLLAGTGTRRILVVCGGGNNGGDGYVIARLARLAGHEVTLLALVPESKLSGDALIAAQHWAKIDAQAASINELDFQAFDAIVDAIFGTGLQRDVCGDFREAIERINAATCPVLAVDIPSGLSADTGQALGIAVKATATISFIGLKQGLFTGSAASYCGAIEYADLAVPGTVFDKVESTVCRIDSGVTARALSRRDRCAHKGDFGHVLVVGGGPGMLGAAILAGSAALRVGAGLVSLATHPMHAALAAVRQPELMSHAVDNAEQLTPLLEKATVVAIGPGLGQSLWAQQLFAKVLDSALPLVVDADALNLLANNQQARGNWVITPHPGEAGRLLGCTTEEVQKDRFSAVTMLVERYQAVTVLKGAGSMIATPGDQIIAVCDRGHPGMATAGMGDVLTGVISGILAQCNNVPDAAKAGAWLHSIAAEQAAVTGERGIVASDLLIPLQAQVNSDV